MQNIIQFDNKTNSNFVLKSEKNKQISSKKHRKKISIQKILLKPFLGF